MDLEDTIAAIATPLGEGGLAVLRLSGQQALTIADTCFVSGPMPKDHRVPEDASSLADAASHTIHYGHVVHQGHVLDEVLVSVMRAPRTFTREDVVEVSCHGGLLPAKLILDALLAGGARLAEPGEFTKRAFLNGRIDLTQAEAVADLIHARTRLALDAANEQLAGSLARRIEQLRNDMMTILAHVEAHIDFPDEDIAPDTHDTLCRRLQEGIQFMEELLRTAPEGQLLRRGIRAAIVGRPNAGKSSLLNCLLGRDRAIVSKTAGTTRDTIEETANIREIPVVFIDTAGLRLAGDDIESEGIRRSRETLSRAELILHVLDGSEPLTGEDRGYLKEFRDRNHLVIRNKMDLSCPWATADQELVGTVIPVCCLSGEGLEGLKDTIREKVWAGDIPAEMLEVMINSRHQGALQRARQATEKTLHALQQGASLDLAALDLRIAVNAIGEIVGKTTTDDLLDSIFSTFCLGK